MRHEGVVRLEVGKMPTSSCNKCEVDYLESARERIPDVYQAAIPAMSESCSKLQ
jgi:hypothetical protein